MKLIKFFQISAGTAAVLLGLGNNSAQSLTLNLFQNPNASISTLTKALLAPNSGINIIVGSESYQGRVGDGQDPNTAQSATYTNFSLAPSSGNSPTLTISNGILLTSGTANLPTTNTLNNFSNGTGSGSNAALSALSSSAGGTSVTNDTNLISFDFTLSDPNEKSVVAEFVFGTDEFPTQSVTDIFGVFVDGVNYAKFPSGELISNTPNNPTNFISNPVKGNLYSIEYNGLSQVLTVVGNLNPNLTTHTIQIGVADTLDISNNLESLLSKSLSCAVNW